MKELRSEIAAAKNSNDSIKLLYDLYDITYQKEEPEVGRMLYNTAGRAGRTDVQLDVLRLLASSVELTEENLQKLIDAAESLPESRDQKETVLYLRLRLISARAAFADEAGRQKNIVEIINDYNLDNNAGDQYEDILKLTTLCSYIKNEVKGDLLVQYLDEVKRLLTESDLELYAFDNLFYTQAANLYAAAGHPKKSVDADKQQLKLIGELEKKYKKQGRKYRDYSRSYYICYRRLLSNYSALTPEEVEDYYRKAKELVKIDPEELLESYEREPRIEIYYNMAKERYAEAIPFIYRQLKVERNLDSKKRLYDMLEAAAEKTGDEEAMVVALEGKNAMLHEYNDLKAAEKYRELQIRYEVGKLQAKNDRLELNQRAEEVKTTRRIMALVLAGWVILALLFAVVLFFFARSRRAAMRVSEVVSDLIDERNRIKHMHYDRSPFGAGNVLMDSSDKSAGEKSTVSALDPDLLAKMVNNMLFIASIGKENRDKHVVQTSVITVMHKAVNGVAASAGPSVEIRQEYPEHDIEFVTDEEAAVKLLEGLLRFSVRNTPGGKVVISGLKPQGINKVRFVIADTGHKVEQGLEHTIFRNFTDFEHLPKNSRVTIICRQIALLLKGGVRVDTTYKEGARIVLTLPMDIKK